MWFLFEIVIFGYLILSGAFLIGFAVSSKKRPHMWVLAVVLMVGWVSVFYGSFIESRRLITTQQLIELDPTPETQIRIAVLSDIHVGPYKNQRWAERVVEKTMDLKPDLIVIAGDFIFSDPDQASMLLPLSGLRAPSGVFAVTGNHDYVGNRPEAIVEALQLAGLTVLENESTSVLVDGHELVIAGLSDLWFAGQPHEAMKGLTDDQMVLLISHNPDAVLYSSTEFADLVIAGHTHGGQIRLPYIGSLARIPTKLGNAYDKGLFTYGPSQLFITAGVGETGPRARLFNPPEINLLTIRF